MKDETTLSSLLGWMLVVVSSGLAVMQILWVACQYGDPNHHVINLTAFVVRAFGKVNGQGIVVWNFLAHSPLKINAWLIQPVFLTVWWICLLLMCLRCACCGYRMLERGTQRRTTRVHNVSNG